LKERKVMNKEMKKKSSKISTTQQAKAAKVSSPVTICELRSKPTASTVAHEDIAKRAYEIYAGMGYPQGQSEQIWRQAEEEIRNGHSAKVSSK
jgi:hypothetical protein